MEASAQDYAKVLKSIDPTWEILNVSETSLKTRGILFKLSTQIPPNLKTGLLLEKPSSKERRNLERKKISYITLNGKVFIALKSGTLRLEAKPSKILRTKRASSIGGRLSPTLLVSPYAFQILDVLFRLTASEIEKFRSASSFCREYGLVQSRISRMMTALKAKTVEDLRDAIRRLDISWWDMAFSYPPARRQLEPFSISAEFYSVLNPALHRSKIPVLKGINGVVQGPTYPAKKVGLLIDPTPTLWCEEKYFNQVKARWKLVPAILRDEKEFHLQIATSKNGFKSDTIQSKINDSHNQTKWIAETFATLNIFRVLFDLSYLDERAREARNELLRRIFHES